MIVGPQKKVLLQNLPGFDSDFNAFERAGLGFITPFVLISGAARIAPRFKLTTAVVASTLVVVGLAYLWFAFILWTPTWLSLRLDVIPSLVSTFLSMVAILAALKFTRPWWEEGA